jgi:hypothetical protein
MTRQSISSFKTRDCQEVLCRKKAKNMREDLT